MSQFDKGVSEASVVVGEEDNAFCMFSQANKENKTLNSFITEASFGFPIKKKSSFQINFC